jgi:hypothetical protein
MARQGLGLGLGLGMGKAPLQPRPTRGGGGGDSNWRAWSDMHLDWTLCRTDPLHPQGRRYTLLPSPTTEQKHSSSPASRFDFRVHSDDGACAPWPWAIAPACAQSFITRNARGVAASGQCVGCLQRRCGLFFSIQLDLVPHLRWCEPSSLVATEFGRHSACYARPSSALAATVLV